MSITDEEFFNENIVNVNKMVARLILCTIAVPISFIVLTLVGLWVVPYWYSAILFGTSAVFTVILYFLNSKESTKIQIISMWLGIIFASIIIFLYGIKGVINLTVAFCFPSIVSCFYYNRKLTNYITIVNFVLVTIMYWTRSYTVSIVSSGIKTNTQWFFENIIGITIEFVFVFMISNYLTKRTNNTMRELVNSKAERDNAFGKLKDKNQTILRINTELGDKNRELNDTQYRIIQFVAQVLGSHDLFTGRHVMHTRKYVEIIAKQLRNEGHYKAELSDRNIELYTTAAFLHDIGKIHIPEGVLNKTGKFTPEEFDLMKCHPTEGKKLLEYLPPIEDGRFNEIAQTMALCYHEKWDGSGYPNHISGTEIPLCARIMAAADVLDALISQRLYKEPVSIDEAMDIFAKSSGMHFEPCIAQAVINCKSMITLIDSDFKTSEASTNAEELEWWMRYHKNLATKL